MTLRPGAALTEELGWEPPLRFKHGAPQRLRGIAVVYDFRWGDYFSDNRVQFHNGQRWPAAARVYPFVRR